MIILITSLFLNPVICLTDYVPSQAFLHKHRSGIEEGKGCDKVSSRGYIQASMPASAWCDRGTCHFQLSIRRLKTIFPHEFKIKICLVLLLNMSFSVQHQTLDDNVST